MSVKAYGTFIKKDGHIYRTNTYIEFGQSSHILGGCILCNPGSSLPVLKEEKQLLEKNNNCDMDTEVVVDATMKQLATILTKIYGEELEGRFYIFNLFTLRDGNMDSAVNKLRILYPEETLLVKDLDDFISMASSLPWVLKGWGCNKSSQLKVLKALWNVEIKKHNNITIGIKGKDLLHYWHPLPQIYNDKIYYVEEIVNQYKTISKVS